jgi:predicted nucleic-acid-binding Zn-ribbon protein
MCASYWSLNVKSLICPYCGSLEVIEDLQTHFRGEPGDCLEYYELGQVIPNLKFIIFGTLSGFGDNLITSCRNCEKTLYYDAEIFNGTITGVSYLPKFPL